jgi:hypothetical protein
MDRGMVSEDNLDSLRERKAAYIVGTPKGQLRQFEQQLLDQSDWSQVQPGVEVKLVEHPDSRGKEQYVIARSTERAEKESAMLILVCFLTLAMWRSLEMWMKSKGLGNCARQLIKEIATVHMMDVILPVRDQGELSLRVVSKPDAQVAQLLAHLGLDLPTAPKIISNVVAKNH